MPWVPWTTACAAKCIHLLGRTPTVPRFVSFVALPKIVRRRHLNDFDRFSRCVIPVFEMHQQVLESDQTVRIFVDGRERFPVHVEYYVFYGLFNKRIYKSSTIDNRINKYQVDKLACDRRDGSGKRLMAYGSGGRWKVFQWVSMNGICVRVLIDLTIFSTSSSFVPPMNAAIPDLRDSHTYSWYINKSKCNYKYVYVVEKTKAFVCVLNKFVLFHTTKLWNDHVNITNITVLNEQI